MAAPTVGDTIPVVELLDLDGNAVSLDRWRGQPILLVFLRHPG
jgi:peroxiredoxin